MKNGVEGWIKWKKNNNAVNKTTGYIPCECLYGFQAKFKDEDIVNLTRKTSEAANHEGIWRNVRENVEGNQRK